MPTSPVTADTWNAKRVLLGFVGAKLLLHLVALQPYGYFRDELYYLACANHLAFGYVDHPPFSVGLLAGWRAMFGDSLVSIRMIPAMAGASLVYMTGLITMKLGGGAMAVMLACLALLCSPAITATDHIYSMNALDPLFWAASALCALRALEQPRLSRWALLGVVLGLGLLNKLSVLWLGVGLAAGLMLTPMGRSSLRTPGPFVAAALTGLLLAPYLFWQVAHQWPTVEFAKHAMDAKYVPLSVGAFLRDSTMRMNPAALPLTVAGLVAPFLSRERAAARPLAIVFVATLLILVSSKASKPEYLDAAYPLIFASGAVWWGNLLALQRPWASRSAAVMYVVSTMALFVIFLPFALPILSERSFIHYADRLGIAPKTSEKKELAELPQHYADMHGWEELVDGTRQAWDSLSPEERGHARIWAVTGGYGSAAAIEVLGAKAGLPRAI